MATTIRPGEALLRAEGDESKLLSLERVGLNLLQRMSGIATAARCLQERVQQRGFRGANRGHAENSLGAAR